MATGTRRTRISVCGFRLLLAPLAALSGQPIDNFAYTRGDDACEMRRVPAEGACDTLAVRCVKRLSTMTNNSAVRHPYEREKAN